jgi:hypothetical protein
MVRKDFLKQHTGFCELLRAIVIATFLSVGCAKSSASDADTTDNVPASADASQRRCSPLRIVLIQDKSLSVTLTRTPQLQTAHLEPLLELMGDCGGELAVGVIHDRSNLSFVRLRIDPAPQEPPPSSPKAGNPLERRKQETVFKKQREEFEIQQQDWLDDMQKRIDAFQKASEPVLAMPANARRSPVWDAVNRAELFLSETEAGRTVEPHRYAVFVTDGLDDVKSHPVPVQSGTRILMVNGSGQLGSLAVLKPQPFESIESAVRFIIDTEAR